MVSEVSVSADDRLAVSGMRRHARLLSTPAFASGRGFQAQPAFRVDAAVYRVRVSELQQERRYRKTSAPRVRAGQLSLDLDRVAGLLLGVSQYALVSIRLLASRVNNHLPSLLFTVL